MAEVDNIVIMGLQRCGTNILYNVLASHPHVTLLGRETGEILDELKIRKWVHSRWNQMGIIHRWTAWRFERYCASLQRSKIADEEFCMKSSAEKYSAEELAKTIICHKSLERDMRLHEWMTQIWPNTRFICIVRNGLAYCESSVRRGASVRHAAKMYKKHVGYMVDFIARNDNTQLIRFEDLVSDPFAVADRLYSWLGLLPATLPELRLKSKRVRSGESQYATLYGKENRHYWFDRTAIQEALEPSVNASQIRGLSETEKQQFVEIAQAELSACGYAVEL